MQKRIDFVLYFIHLQLSSKWKYDINETTCD